MRKNFSLIAGLGAGALLLAGTACRQQGQQQGQEDQQQGQQQQREDQQGMGGAGDQEQQKQEQQKQEQEGPQQSLTGRVTSVDGDTIRVIDSQRDEVVEIKIPEDAQVTRGGQEIKVDDITAGAEVRASYSMKDGERVARSVTVTSGGQQQ